MAKTLRGSMIVGYYKKDKEDFTDHGHIMTIDDEGIHFEVKTTPYGFVSPDAKVWFQTFQEQDEDLNPIEREYLMTTGYLWTKAFPETQEIFKQGRPQSMELDSDSVSGQWTKSLNHDYEILIVNDAIFSKLCILGEDVEPCFEGASITRPEISANFTLEESFKNSVYTMMNEFKEVLQGGKQQMENMEKQPVSETSEMESAATAYVKEDEDKKNDTAATDAKESDSESKGSDSEASAEKKEDDDKKKKDDNYSLESSVEVAADVIPAEEYEALKNKYSALEKTVAELTAFKNTVEREKKTSLIAEFTMLTDDDKADVVNNIDKYTLDEIESKLSVKCFRKKVNFVSTDSDKNDNITETQKQETITTYSLGGVGDSTPNWIKAVESNSAM